MIFLKRRNASWTYRNASGNVYECKSKRIYAALKFSWSNRFGKCGREKHETLNNSIDCIVISNSNTNYYNKFDLQCACTIIYANFSRYPKALTFTLHTPTLFFKYSGRFCHGSTLLKRIRRVFLDNQDIFTRFTFYIKLL